VTTLLGQSHTLRFGFDAGLLRRLIVGVQRKPPVDLIESIYATDAALGELSDAYTFVAPDGATSVRATQELGVGLRHLELRTDTSGNAEEAHLLIAFDLWEPLEWRLWGPSEFRLGDDSVEASTDNKVSVVVTCSTAQITIHERECAAELATGQHHVTISVRSTTVFRCGTTAIACRPQQIREAAIAASTLFLQPYTPIVAIAAPPEPRESYLAAFAEFRNIQTDFMSRGGGRLALEELLAADGAAKKEFLRKSARLNAARERLTPYRTWLRYNHMMSTLLAQLGIERVIQLHPFGPDDLITTDPGHRHHDDDESVFGAAAQLLTIDCTDVTSLSRRLWDRLVSDLPYPADPLRVAAHRAGDFVAALYVALRRGVPIEAVDGDPPDILDVLESTIEESDEAVLVELTGDVDSLVAAQYAGYRSAQLVITPRPDLSAVQEAVAKRQREVLGGERLLGPPSLILFNRLLRVLSRRRLPRSVRRIQTAVTEQVPSEVVERVGDRRVTVFTSGLPYPFVRTQNTNWADKPIGHIAADATLLILNEIVYEGRAHSRGRFALVFDPGFFRRSETPTVIESVRSYFTYPILLAGRDASLDSLIELPARLPVELVFFNTHGSDDSIVLSHRDADGPMELGRAQIAQWLNFSHRPIVINNSCESWTGVGREFIRVGARGYVGTLWSIPVGAAARIGETLITRITTGNMALAGALLNIDAGGTELAYLYVGTVNGRLDRWPDRGAGPGEVAIQEGQLLSEAADRAAKGVATLLRKEIRNLTSAISQTPHANDVQYLDLLLDELALLHRADWAELRSSLNVLAELTSLIDHMLETLELSEEALRNRTVRRLWHLGNLAERFGDNENALRLLSEAFETANDDRYRARLRMETAQLLIDSGQVSTAIPLLEESRQYYRDASEQVGVVETTGTLGQAYRRVNELGMAMDCARQGFDAAAELPDSAQQQAAFKIDQSFLHQMMDDLEGAIAAADAALTLARISSDPSTEASAFGRRVTLRILTNDLDAAEQDAKRGLKQAESLSLFREIAGFHHDLAQINALLGRFALSVKHLQSTIVACAQSGSWEIANDTMPTLFKIVHEHENSVDFADLSLWAAVVVASYPAVGPYLGELYFLALSKVAQSAPPVPWARTVAQQRNALAAIGQAGAVDDADDEITDSRTLFRALLGLLAAWREDGASPSVRRRAEQLDSMTGGRLELQEFVQRRVPPG
jgi:tetratricopeptide (TPR) repeat protein